MNHRWVARGLVAALHLALLAALWQHRPASLDEPGERRLTSVRILLPPPPRMPPVPAPRPLPTPRISDPKLLAPPPTTPEAQVPPETPAAPAAPPPAMPGTEPARSTTLRLTLPPGYAASSAAARNPALSDPRANSVKPTLESRIANAAAVTGEWVEERTSDGRTRRRRGDTCVETQESRIASIDRFNQNVAPRGAAMTGEPYKCQ